MSKLSTTELITKSATEYKQASDTEFIPLAFNEGNACRELAAALEISEDAVRVVRNSVDEDGRVVYTTEVEDEDDEYEVAEDDTAFPEYRGLYESPNGFVYRKNAGDEDSEDTSLDFSEENVRQQMATVLGLSPDDVEVQEDLEFNSFGVTQVYTVDANGTEYIVVQDDDYAKSLALAVATRDAQEVINTEGWQYFLSQDDGNSDETPAGFVYCRRA